MHQMKGVLLFLLSFVSQETISLKLDRILFVFSLHLPSLMVLFRGINVVREQIKMFARKKVNLPPGRHKIIILDEADKFALSHLLLSFTVIL
jgi:hypothetical protein